MPQREKITRKEMVNNLIVRFTILFCAIYFLVVLYYAWNGENVFNDSYKLLLELCLFIQASENKKFNCRYIRFLALSLFLSDTITVLDMYLNFIPNGIVACAVLSALWAIGIVTTIVLSINHFRKVRNINKRRNCNEYRLK